MDNFECPKCHKAGVSFADKYKAGIWRVIFCQLCGARLCGHPLLLALGYIIYVWLAATFGFWAYYEKSIIPILYMIPAWLFLDFINIKYMPLSIMRRLDK